MEGSDWIEERTVPAKPHRFTLTNRKIATITGVSDVRSFDETQAVLETSYGLLTIKGRGLHVKRLTLEQGEMDFEGHVDSFVYVNAPDRAEERKNLMARLFG